MSKYTKITENKYLEDIEKGLESLIYELTNHPIYQKINSLEALRVFSQHHVFASWDAMSLFKNLQRTLSSDTVFWVNPKNPIATRYINKLMIEEESDMSPDMNDGLPISHFDLYLNGMKEIGASSSQIMEFLKDVESDVEINEAMKKANLAEHIQSFIKTTFKIITSQSSTKIAASIYFARENLIPVIFPELLKKDEIKGDFSILNLYIDRHVVLDKNRHTFFAREILISICKEDKSEWEKAKQVAIDSINARIILWDGIVKAIDEIS